MIKIVTFNLRCVWDRDGINSFIHRAGAVQEKILKEMPDIIGFQEVIPRQRDWMEWMERDYTIVGQFRDENFSGEGTFIAVKKSSYDVLAFDTFWLSPTPYKAGSRYEKQSDCPRICNIVRIRNKATGEICRVLNLHLDHVSDEAKILGLQCALKHLRELDEKAYFPSIIMGDFNAEPESETIQMLNSYQGGGFADVTVSVPCTFHDYGRRSVKIDYIYMTGMLAERVNEIGVWDDEHEGIYLSDHYPVYVICRE